MRKALSILLVLLLLCGCANTESLDSVTSSETNITESPVDYSKQISEVEELLPIGSHVDFAHLEGTTHIRVELFVNNSTDDFGISLYKIHQYCTTSMISEPFEIHATVFNNANVEQWQYTFLSSTDGYGILTDKRGSYEKNTEFNTLEIMKDYFPLLNRYLLEQNINPDDLELYHEIVEDIQNYRTAYVDSSTVFTYVANQYDMSSSQLNFFLLEVESRINSGNIHSARIPLVYPRSLKYDDSLGIEEIPEITYTTKGSENGLAGNVYYIEGEVVRYESLEIDNNSSMNLFVIKNDLGEFIVGDFVSYMLDYGQKEHYSNSVIKVIQEATANEDCQFPKIGQQVKVYCIYQGFSEYFELPIAYLGINDYSEIL